MLNSAAGVTLPRPVEPPISTISRIRSCRSGRAESSCATLVSGPVGTSVTGSGAASSVSTISSIALRESSGASPVVSS